MYPYRVYGMATYASEKTTNHGGGEPNLVRYYEEKMSKVILENRITRWTKSQIVELGLPQHLN
jgi:hypothetical protein